jgi:hypothetical protein
MWVFVLLQGCSNSGLDRSSTDSAESAAPAGLEDCPWVGEWELDEVKCGGTFAYNQWYEELHYDGATMVIAHDPDGGCAVETTIRGETCRRKEEAHFAPVGTSVTVVSDGITDCTPNKCTFFTGDAECTREALAGETTARVEEVVGTMTAVDLLRNTIPVGSCSLEIYTIWSKEP